MIRKLQSLRMTGFRPFLRDTGEVPLDADVILVYGPNGSGKTGLMSAIECAVTGSVSHLQEYSADYPRCLRHTGAAGTAEVSVQYLNEYDALTSTQVRIAPTADGKCSVTREGKLDLTKAMLFSERCYLSQNRLSRLLEIYQASGKGSEQHLVRFARELLGLDLLENLIDGLYVVKHKGRLQNSLPALENLERDAAQLALQRGRAADVLKAERARWESAVARLKELEPEWAAHTDDREWTLEAIQSKRKVIEERLASAPRAEEAKVLQRRLGEIDSAVGFIQAIPRPDASDQSQLARELEEKSSRVRKHATALRSTLEHLRSRVGLASQDEQENSPRELEAAYTSLESEVRRRLLLARQEESDFSQAERDAKKAQAEVDRLTAEIASADKEASSYAGVSQRRVTLLQVALECVNDETCPVCSRRFDELGQAQLHDHVRMELQRLGVALKDLEATMSRRTGAEALRDAAKRKLALNLQLIEQFRTGAAAREASLQTLRQLGAECETTLQPRRLLESFEKERSDCEVRLQVARERDKQVESGIRAVRGATRTLLPKVGDDLPVIEMANLTRAEIQRRTKLMADEISRANGLLSALAFAAEQRGTLDRAQSALDRIESGLAEHRKAKADTEKLRDLSREIERTAQNVKATLIREVFNERLNTLCLQLYQRLVRVEAFDPRLSEPRLQGGQVRAGVQAVSRKGEQVEPFTELASVVSSSNLNTAALCLFISLNLVQNPEHRVMLFDDPVQSMDDVHVVQLATLLRALVREGKRQLVVAVHERAMFEYLQLELGPTREGDSLVALELARDADGMNTAIKVQKRTWQADPVSFGATRRPAAAG
jgi:exonuclease SbcC